MGVRKSKEPDPEQARHIAEGGCILRGVVGSTVHGLSSPGTDDRDEMGVCIEPQEYVLGLRPFEHWVYRTQPEGSPSGPGDPTVLLLLFIDEPSVMVRTPLGAELQTLAPAFVSKRSGRAFLGYLDTQRRGLLGDRHATRARELSAEHGYDTKYAMHALRIAYQGIELITTGRISLPVPDDARRHLMAVRRGELPLPQVVADLHAKGSELEQAVLATDLPEAADRSTIDGFLVRAYERAWSTR